jgi:hypothetical protein
VVSSGEAASYNSDSKQTIPGPVGHRAEIEEAVALAASSFFQQPHFSFVVHFCRTLFLSDAIFAATVPTSSLVAMRGQGVLGLLARVTTSASAMFTLLSWMADMFSSIRTTKIGTLVSSRRFKEEIKPMDRASETIHALKPVTFRYKRGIDSAGTSQFGLVAEDVEKVSPALIVRDKEGKPYSVRYDQVNAMLLNEFLKEHRKVDQQRKDFEAAIAQQQKQIEALIEGLQKVSAQLEASKPAPKVVANK